MRVNIITKLQNKKGLEREYKLLRSVLEELGHKVHGCEVRQRGTAKRADLNIFLEIFEPYFIRFAPRQWLVPDPDWWFEEQNSWLNRFERILCKTEDAMRLFSPLTDKCVLTGFFSADHYLPSVLRKREFLHNPGASPLKNTGAILDAWERFKIRHPLTIVGRLDEHYRPMPDVRFFKRVSDNELMQLQNSHLFHLCVSKYEGWGHYLHEALGVGAIVITTDAPPMNEWDGCAQSLRVKPHAAEKYRLATTHEVSPVAIRDAVDRCVALGDEEVRSIAKTARAAFEAERANFVGALQPLLDGLIKPRKWWNFWSGGQGVARIVRLQKRERWEEKGTK